MRRWGWHVAQAINADRLHITDTPPLKRVLLVTGAAALDGMALSTREYPCAKKNAAWLSGGTNPFTGSPAIFLLVSPRGVVGYRSMALGVGSGWIKLVSLVRSSRVICCVRWGARPRRYYRNCFLTEVASPTKGSSCCR